MNPFIRALEESGDLSRANLKKLFRQASKKAHPDTARRGGEAFIRLRKEYEEALAILSGGDLGRKEKLDPSTARIALLKKLYLFGMKVFTAQADALLDGMIKDARAYDEGLAALLSRYRAEIYASHKEWSGKANLFYAHSVFISGIRQLFLYYNSGSALHRTLVLRYREAMGRWTWNLPGEFKEILARLYAWLESELDKEKVEYYG